MGLILTVLIGLMLLGYLIAGGAGVLTVLGILGLVFLVFIYEVVS